MEVLIDFILTFHENYKAGIFWISCQRAEFVNTTVEIIEAVSLCVARVMHVCRCVMHVLL